MCLTDSSLQKPINIYTAFRYLHIFSLCFLNSPSSLHLSACLITRWRGQQVKWWERIELKISLTEVDGLSWIFQFNNIIQSSLTTQSLWPILLRKDSQDLPTPFPATDAHVRSTITQSPGCLHVLLATNMTNMSASCRPCLIYSTEYSTELNKKI